MKLRITIGLVVAALLCVVAFTACETQYEDAAPKAELLSLRVGGMVLERSADAEKNRIPNPVSNKDWSDEEAYDLYGADFKTIAFRYEADIIDAWFEPTVTPGAQVKWGIANRTVRPGTFYDTRVPATFNSLDFLYFEVTSKGGETTNYYRFSTYVRSPVKELSAISLAGVEFEGDITKDVFGAPTWNGDTITEGILYIKEDAINHTATAEVDATPWAATSTLRYARTPDDRTAPVFGENNTLEFGDGNYLYVEVKAENEDINIYRFKVFVGRIATIRALTFKTRNPAGEEIDVEALGKGTAKYDWMDNSGAGSFSSPHQPVEGFGFSVDLDEPNGKWQWAHISRPAPNTLATIPSDPPTFSALLDNAAVVPIGELLVYDNEYLIVKVVPPNRAAGNTRADYYYKVKIGLLAAQFTEQPLSAYYTVDTTAAALTFKLDKPIPNAKYQWWEANSWYGGYGFDSKGRIGSGKAMAAEAGWGTEDAGILKADGTVEYVADVPHSNSKRAAQAVLDLAEQYPDGIIFDVSGWHQEGIDEKDNVSLHNGGNQYYNLPTPGKPIPGATGESYIPPIDSASRRPFLAGFTNETHYYWVEVTDPATGLKAVSKRAFIVTEFGVKYTNGHAGTAASDQVSKKHYIIDLYAYQRGDSADGLRGPPLNEIPFKKGNHGDEYVIPLKFPAGFDINDYSVVTAQAMFYLADGRVWIQNWTQGDFGFWALDEETNEDKQVVLWYNVTNDNATRGLASSGNEPQGGGLNATPTHLVVKPAGTKPIKEMPPFEDGLGGRPGPNFDILGRPIPHSNNNAQGWFTPYIEICEIRFEGPAR